MHCVGGAEDKDERLDLLDAEGRVVGTIRREDAHGSREKRHRAVHVFVTNTGGAILLQKRSENKSVQPGRWDTSCGGHVPAGESWENAALRELAEEIGLFLPSPGSLRFSHEYWWKTGIETERVRTYTVTSSGPFRFHPAEISEGRFWTSGEIMESLGSGIFTPNLLEELRILGILPG